jgi:hypothetical protein
MSTETVAVTLAALLPLQIMSAKTEVLLERPEVAVPGVAMGRIVELLQVQTQAALAVASLGASSAVAVVAEAVGEAAVAVAS